MLKITLAQRDLTVGDIDGNIDQMVKAARQAQAGGVTHPRTCPCVEVVTWFAEGLNIWTYPWEVLTLPATP